MTQPLVSVVITNYNYADFVGAAIESALAQRHEPTEVVVVDDGSTDDSRDVISRYDGVVAVFKPNGNQTSALNEGFRVARGDWICMLDSDDMLKPAAIDTALTKAGPEVAKIQWPMELIDRFGFAAGGVWPGHDLESGDLRDVVLRDGPESYSWERACNGLFSRAFLEQILPLEGPSTDAQAGGATSPDTNLADLAPLYGRVESAEHPLSLRRLHDSNSYAAVEGETKLELDLRHFDYRCDLLARHARAFGYEVDPSGWRRRSWLHRFVRVRARLAELVEEGERVVLIDDAQVGAAVAPGREVVPFTERNGVYWGPPADDTEAIEGIDRLVAGDAWVVVAWPAFWWLDHYAGFDAHLRANASTVVADDSLIAYRVSAN